MLGDDPIDLPITSGSGPVGAGMVQIKEAHHFQNATLSHERPVGIKFLLWPEVQAYRQDARHNFIPPENTGLFSRTICRAQVALDNMEFEPEPKLMELMGMSTVKV